METLGKLEVLTNEIDALLERLSSLKAENSRLEADIKFANMENERLREEREAIRDRIKNLVSRLG